MYRDAAVTISCPRCGSPLPGGELTCCACGVWVSAELAATALDAAERAPNRVMGWWRPLAACPFCNEAMTRRGHDMVPLLGCDDHGFWIDEENVAQTQLTRRAGPLLDQARNTARLAAQDRQREREAQRQLERERRSAQLAEEQKAAAEAKAAREALNDRQRARERAAQPYLDLIRRAQDGDPLPLAEKLAELEALLRGRS